ncbi:transposase [Aureispira sp. CCB-E]|uniref:transposase n=1 Tax=Aureispira sp. CCB-E TaxID=3051121 RepID=UPI002868E304|nr:transposase [Aureispira sp. CCB-E]WMX14729.1 transposase [Aureispira sp. CCB-E]
MGIFSALTVIAETAGFDMVKSAKQLTSFAGLDVVQRQSGTSIKGKTRISKKGNAHIRRALYFPAMVAARFNPQFKAVYKRIVQKGKPKKVANIALERRLLCLIYVLWKNEQSYIENYEELKQEKNIAPELAEATQDSPKTS